MAEVSRIIKSTNVLEEAYKRYEYIFDEFENVVVGFSGGKDSTVTLEIDLEIAKKRNRLPLDVVFIDQEGEFENTISYMRRIRERPDINLHWYQMPIMINVSTNMTETHLFCWDEKDEDKWIRPKEEGSIGKNVYCKKETYFNDLFNAILRKDFGDKKTAFLGGVRTEEAPKRLRGLTMGDIYKGITWGKKVTKQIIIFYPLYDWTTSDIWIYIERNKLDYCRIYDLMYNIGLPLRNMRVSSIFHENSLNSLGYLAELEKDNWNKVVNRIQGANTVKSAEALYSRPKELPYMFKDWKEYSEHLFDTILTEDMKPVFKKGVEQRYQTYLRKLERRETPNEDQDGFWKVACNEYLRNDFCFTLLNNFLIK